MLHVLVGFVEVAVDGRVPVVGFILNMNIGRMQCEFNFAKDSTVTIYLRITMQQNLCCLQYH